MEKAKKSVEQMAKEANGRSRACKDCSDAFIEGFKKGYEQGRKG